MTKQVALVTGASSGIGRATARLFAASRFRVFGTSRAQHPDADGVEMLKLDVTSDDSVTRCVEEVLTRAGHIDVLVNNAGMWQVSIAEETPLSIAQAIFDINFFGVVRMTDAALPGMRKREAGRIINVGSLRRGWVSQERPSMPHRRRHCLAIRKRCATKSGRWEFAFPSLSRVHSGRISQRHCSQRRTRSGITGRFGSRFEELWNGHSTKEKTRSGLQI